MILLALRVPFIPEQASTLAGRVDALYYYLIGITAIFSLLIAFSIFYFAIRYRRRTPDELPRPVAGSMLLEITWTVVPLLLAMTIFVWGASVYFAQFHIPEDALEVFVVAKQWMWKFQHLTGQREINELHVPVGRKIKLTMTTEDVIHSLYVPAFRIKMDVVPGRVTATWFEATREGRYHLFCAEYCGTSHSGMTGWVVVMTPAQYQSWLGGVAAGESMASLGQKVYQSLGCATCHDGADEALGPSLKGLHGRPRKLESGQTVGADDSYIRESIVNPGAKVLQGYAPLMPTFQGQVSEEQLLHLVAYIRSLAPPSEPRPEGRGQSR